MEIGLGLPDGAFYFYLGVLVPVATSRVPQQGPRLAHFDDQIRSPDPLDTSKWALSASM